MTRRVTTRQSVLSQGKTEISQKTSGSLGNFRADETNVNDAPKAILERVPYIHYPTTFRKKSVLALLDSRSGLNAIHPTFAKDLGLRVRSTNLGAQKTDGTTLDTIKW